MTIKLESNETTHCVVGSDISCRRSEPSKLSNGSFSYNEDVGLYSSRHDSPAIVPSSCSEFSGSGIVRSYVIKTPTGLDVKEIAINSACETADAFSVYSSDYFVDDDSTVCTVSDSSSDGKRVRFAEPIVTEVKTRPRTSLESLRNLFYSYEETQRFRQEYRLERKVLARMDVDTVNTSVSQSSRKEDISSTKSRDKLSNLERSGRHRISRVVVCHNDVLETFYEKDISKTAPHQPVINSGKSISNVANDDFFDNDSFWSGSITWF